MSALARPARGVGARGRLPAGSPQFQAVLDPGDSTNRLSDHARSQPSARNRPGSTGETAAAEKETAILPYPLSFPRT